MLIIKYDGVVKSPVYGVRLPDSEAETNEPGAHLNSYSYSYSYGYGYELRAIPSPR